MAQLQINTTQNVNINFIYASIGERILAFCIDVIVKFAYIMAIYLVFNKLKLGDLFKSLDKWSVIAVMSIFLLPIIFYTLIFEIFLDGQTIGKRILKIKVIKINGYQASFYDYLVRWLFRIIDLNMCSGIVALISIVSSEKNQRLGDITAGTSVISLKDNKVKLNHTIIEDLHVDYIPKYPNVIKLTDNDVRIIKESFLKAKKNQDTVTLKKLRKKITEVIELQNAHQEDDVQFINSILKDFNYYTQGK